MKLGPAFDYQIYRTLGPQLGIVINEGIQVDDLNILVDMGSGGLRCVHCWKFDVGEKLVFGATNGQRRIERIEPRVIVVVIGKERSLFEMEGV